MLWPKKGLKTNYLISCCMVFCGLCNTWLYAQSLNEKTFTIGMTANFKPYNYIENDQFTGVDIEIANATFSRLKFKTKYLELPLPRVTAMAVQGDIDIILSVYCNDQRSALLVNTREPFYTVDVSAFELISQPKRIESLSELSKQHFVGAVRGSSFIDELPSLLASQLMLSLNTEYLVNQLDKQRIDFVLDEELPLLFFAKQAQVKVHKVFKLLSYDVCMSVSKLALAHNVDVLVSEIDNVVRELKQNGSINNILQKYMGKEMAEQQR